MAHLNQHRLAVLTSWKGTTETNTRNLCLEFKLGTANYGRITVKNPIK